MDNTFTLKAFIENSLIEICEAVEGARNKHGYIAPKIYVDPNRDKKATVVDFDVAVIVTDSESVKDAKEGGVSGGLKIGIVRAEAKIRAHDEKNAASNSSKESRIKFSVPIFFQLDEERRQKILEENKNSSAPIDRQDGVSL